LRPTAAPGISQGMCIKPRPLIRLGFSDAQ
jgi:hypothetical protein